MDPLKNTPEQKAQLEANRIRRERNERRLFTLIVGTAVTLLVIIGGAILWHFATYTDPSPTTP